MKTKNQILKAIRDQREQSAKKKITCLFVSNSETNSKASGIIHLHQILQYVE